MVQKFELKKIIFLICLMIATLFAGCFSFSFKKVEALDCCSSSSPHIISELGYNNSGASETSFNYYAINGMFEEEGHFFKQTADIVMDNSNSIYLTELNSTYDGGNNRFELSDNSGNIFETIGTNGTLQNLNVESVRNSNLLGVVAGVADTLYGTLKSVSYSGEITIGSGVIVTYVGGLVARNIGGTIINCSNLADITYKGTGLPKTGGLVGFQEGGSIYSSYNWGNILLTEETTCYVGGLVGQVSGLSTIRNCYNSGFVIENTSNTAVLGGLVGAKTDSDKLSLIQCYNVGTISGGNPKGALVGKIASSTNDVFNYNYYLKATNLYSCGNFAGEVGSDKVGYAKTETELSNNSTYKGWLFGFSYPNFASWIWSKNTLGLEIDGKMAAKKLPRLSFESIEVLTPFTITFDKNDDEATGTMEPQVLYKEKAYPINDCTFVKEGFKVVGWSLSKGGGEVQYQCGEAISIDRDITLYAVWDYESSYTLTFDANGGECDIESKIVHTGVEIGDLPVPIRLGYYFYGWVVLTIQIEQLSPATIYSLEHDAIAVAQWGIARYNINYYDQPATDGGAYTQVYTMNLSYNEEGIHPTWDELGISERDSLISVGYSLNQTGMENIYEFGSTFKVSDLVTENDIYVVNLYIQYAESEYTLTLDAVAGRGIFASSGSAIKKLAVTYGEPLTNLNEEVPTYTGYTLTSWELKRTDGTPVTDSDGNAVRINETTVWGYLSDLIAEAKWTPIQYTVEFYQNDGTTTKIATESCVYDIEYLYPETSWTGRTFLGYSQYEDGSTILEDSKPGGTGKYKNLLISSGTLKLYAIWKEHTYTLNYHINNSALSESDFSETYLYSQSSTIRNNSNFPGAGENTRYVLNSFNTNASGTGVKYPLNYVFTEKVAEDGAVIDLYAIWEKVWSISVAKHSSSPSAGGFAYLTIDGGSTQYTSRYIINGTSITLGTTINNGYGFVAWYDSNNNQVSTSSSYTLNASKDCTYYALWEQTIVYCACSSNGCTGEAYYNGYCVNCYSGSSNWCSESGCGGCTLHNTFANHVYYSMYAGVGSTGSATGVTTWISVGGTTYTSMPQSVHKGKVVSFVTSSSTGTFLGWYTGTTTSSTYKSNSHSYSFTASENITLYAIWTYYECACDGCSTEVSGENTQCSFCDGYSQCGSCYNCSYHNYVCSLCSYCDSCGCECSWCDCCNGKVRFSCEECDDAYLYCSCGKCSNHYSICSTCGYCSYCGCQCHPCECCGITYVGEAGFYCPNCVGYAKCIFCGDCSLHYTLCSTCGGCVGYCCICRCSCGACDNQISGGGLCSDCIDSYCSICGSNICLECCPEHECYCCGEYNKGSIECTDCYGWGACADCSRCLKHCQCSFCVCCGTRFTGNYNLCSGCRSLGYGDSEYCGSCGQCYGHAFGGNVSGGGVCYACGNCSGCCPNSGDYWCSSCLSYTGCAGTTCEICGNCSLHCSCTCFCCGASGGLSWNTDAATGTNPRPYCGSCIGTGWCYTCDSCGACHAGNNCNGTVVTGRSASYVLPRKLECQPCLKKDEKEY